MDADRLRCIRRPGCRGRASVSKLPHGASVGDGRTLIGTRVGPSAGPSFIDSFRVGFFGRLTPAADSPIPAQRIGLFGSAFRPTNPRQLFVSNAHDGAGLGSVSVYHVARDATLTAINGSPFADNQTAPCWVAITPDGKYLFAVKTPRARQSPATGSLRAVA